MRLRLLLILFLSGFSLTLVLGVPVRLLWHQFGSSLELPAEPAALRGNLWHGRAFIPWADDMVSIQWQWLPTELLRGHLAYDLRLQARDTDLETRVGVAWSQWRIHSSDGVVGLHLLGPVLQPYSVSLAGQVRVDSLALQWAGQSAPGGAGVLTLRNGRYSLGSPESSGLPILRAEVTSPTTDRLTITVDESGSGKALVLGEITAETAMVRLYAAWRDVLGRELPGGRRVLMESEWTLPEWLP